MAQHQGGDRRVVVIGSGPAGAMAAHELIRNGIAVTMLESGTEFQGGLLVRLMGRNLLRKVPPMRPNDGFTVSGDDKTNWHMNLAPGGLSCQWTGAVPRFAPEDFTEGERLDARYRWPISYSDIAPYYDRAERLLQITGERLDVPNLPAGTVAFPHHLPQSWQGVAKVARSHGQGFTVMPLADGPQNMVARRGTAFNSFTAIVRKLMRSPNFQLLTGAHALQLEWNGEKKRVTAVVFHDRANACKRRLEASAVVVACGALSSTKLLFDSACSDFPDGLGNAEGVLGCYLHDHPREWWSFELDKPITLLAPAAYLTRLPHATSKPLMANSWTLGVVTTKDKILSRFGGQGKTVGVQVFGSMVPKAHHRVRPADKKTDTFGLPILDICIQFDDEVIANMVRARGHLMSVMEAAGYRAKLHDVVPQLFPGSAVHYGGTARMHGSRQYGMLDARNRIYDVSNVAVCDASCFTTSSEKNPTLTVMAIAARAAEYLATDLKRM